VKIGILGGALDSDFKRYRNKTYVREEIKLLDKLFLLLTNPGLFAIVNHRYGCWILSRYSSRDLRYYRYFFNLFYYMGKKISIMWGKIDILDGLQIGPGIFISNKGGVFLGAESIGSNCTIDFAVTIGLDHNGHRTTLENNVVVGNNTVIYGKNIIRNGCVIGSNSVLTKSIPEKVYMKGNPAKLQKNNIDSQDFICLNEY